MDNSARLSANEKRYYRNCPSALTSKTIWKTKVILGEEEGEERKNNFNLIFTLMTDFS